MKTLHYFTKLMILTISFTLLVFIDACKKENYCELLTVDGNGNQPWISNNCSGSSGSYTRNILKYDSHGRPLNYTVATGNANYEISNVLYDQFSRPISYSFLIKCGSKTKYKGNVYNVQYNGIGQALYYKAEIENTTCTYTR